MSTEPGISKRCAAEFLGTFLFVFVGAGSAVASGSLLVAAIANGLGLAIGISATMGISGGHLNPAVTLGLLVGKKAKGKDVVPYIISQVLGATIAGLLLIAVLPSDAGKAAGWGAPSLNVITVAQGTVLELIMTFLLVTAVYATIVDKRAPKIAGFGVGLIVLADVLVGGPFTGAAMNPARATGPMIAGLVSGLSFPSYWYIYWIGPIIGAVLAGIVYTQLLESKTSA